MQDPQEVEDYYGVECGATIPRIRDAALPLRKAHGLRGVAQAGDGPRSGKDSSPHYGDAAVRHALLHVRPVDVEKVRHRVEPAQIPEEDRLLCEMVNLPRHGRRPDGAAARALFAGLRGATGKRRRMAARVLMRAVERGLAAEDAMKIVEDCGLEGVEVEHRGDD